MIAQGYPLIAKLYLNKNQQHFVVVTGLSGNDFFINDPAQPKPMGRKTPRRHPVTLFATYSGTLPLFALWVVRPGPLVRSCQWETRTPDRRS